MNPKSESHLPDEPMKENKDLGVIPERTMDQCGAEKGPLPPNTVLIPWPPTREMMMCLYVDKWPGDWERGKRLQREWRDDYALGAGSKKEDSPRIIPYNTEAEVVAGQLERFVEAAQKALADAPVGASPRQVEDASPGRTQSDPNQIRKAGRG